jgi:hypothetical protein
MMFSDKWRNDDASDIQRVRVAGGVRKEYQGMEQRAGKSARGAMTKTMAVPSLTPSRRCDLLEKVALWFCGAKSRRSPPSVTLWTRNMVSLVTGVSHFDFCYLVTLTLLRLLVVIAVRLVESV